jgi:hypothetical protein
VYKVVEMAQTVIEKPTDEILNHPLNVRFSEGQFETLSKAASLANLDRSELIRCLVAFAYDRLKAWGDAHPLLPWVPLERALADNWDAKQAARADEHLKAAAWLDERHRVQEIDGGLAAINWQLDSKVMAFYNRAWDKGLAVAELIEQAATVEAEKRQAVARRLDVDMDEPMPEPLLLHSPERPLPAQPDPLQVRMLRAELARSESQLQAWRWLAAIALCCALVAAAVVAILAYRLFY